MTRILSLVAVSPSRDCADELRAACAGMPGVRMEVRDSWAAGTPADRAVILEYRRCAEDRQLLAQLARQESRPVIAVVVEPTVADVRELMHFGALDVVARPVPPTELAEALALARERLQSVPQSRGRIHSFLRSCGGVGATTIAVQTALELLGRDRRAPAKVCLIDLDLQFGNAGLALDLVGSSGLAQVLQGSARLDAEFLDLAMAHHDSGLDVLTAPGEIVPFEALAIDTVERLLALAQERYDHVVVDLPHGWTGWTPAVLAASSLIVLVLRPTVSGIARTRAHLRLIREERLEAVPRLIVANRVERGLFNGWQRSLREAAGALEQDIDVLIRRDDDTADAARERGKPLHAVKRNSVIEKDVREFAGRILALTAGDARRGAQALPAGGFSLRQWLPLLNPRG